MPNWSQILSGAAGGALAGGTAGSAVPIVGTALGAGLGALTGGFAGGLGNRDKKSNSNNGFEQSPNRFSPQQQNALNQLLQQGQAGLQNPTSGFQPIEDYAKNKFQRESIPGLAERFTSVGGSGTRGSSDFAGILGGAQSEFDQGLASLKAQYGQQGQQNALQMLAQGLTPQNEQIYFGQAPKLGNQLLEMGGNIFGQYLAGGGNFGSNKDSSDSMTSQQENKDAIIKALRSILQKRGA